MLPHQRELTYNYFTSSKHAVPRHHDAAAEKATQRRNTSRSQRDPNFTSSKHAVPHHHDAASERPLNGATQADHSVTQSFSTAPPRANDPAHVQNPTRWIKHNIAQAKPTQEIHFKMKETKQRDHFRCMATIKKSETRVGAFTTLRKNARQEEI